MKRVCLLLLLFSFSSGMKAMQAITEHVYGAPIEYIGPFCMFRIGTEINQDDLDGIFTAISTQCNTPLLVIRIAHSGGKLLVFHSDKEGLSKDIQEQLATHRITHLTLKEHGKDAWPAIIRSRWVMRHIPHIIDEVCDEEASDEPESEC